MAIFDSSADRYLMPLSNNHIYTIIDGRRGWQGGVTDVFKDTYARSHLDTCGAFRMCHYLPHQSRNWNGCFLAGAVIFCIFYSFICTSASSAIIMAVRSLCVISGFCFCSSLCTLGRVIADLLPVLF